MDADFADQQAAAAQQAAQEAAAAAAAAAQQAAAQQAAQAAQAAAVAGVPLDPAAAAALIQQQVAAINNLEAKVSTLEICYKAANTYAKLMPKPEPLDGKNAAKVGSWLWRLEHFMSIMNFVKDWDRIQLAISYLTGPALDWWRGIEESDIRPTTWEGFKTQLQATFQDVNSVENARNQLAKVVHISTVRQFAALFRNITLKIPGITDEEKKHRFMAGLKREIRVQTAVSAPSTFDEAVETAERIETAFYMATHNTNRSNTFNTNRASNNAGPSNGAYFRNGGSTGPTSMEVDLAAANAVNRNNNQRSSPHRPRRPRLTEELRRQLMRQNRCFFCREPDHHAVDCPEKKALGL